MPSLREQNTFELRAATNFETSSDVFRLTKFLIRVKFKFCAVENASSLQLSIFKNLSTTDKSEHWKRTRKSTKKSVDLLSA